MNRQLDETIIDHGIRNTHYFNGRLLTADDLRADQAANRQQHWQLGQAIGEGVINGLEVKLIEPGAIGKLPVVEVSQGLALNRLGQMLALPNNEQLTLTPKSETVTSASVFSDCDKETDFSPSLADGFYLLVIKPASGFQESAPVRGLFGAGTVAGCGSRYEVAGVQFRLVKLDLSKMTNLSSATQTQINTLASANDLLSVSKLRNLLAHVCFGTEELLGIAREPFKRSDDRSAYAKYGALEFLRTSKEMNDCEVPLALFHWLGRSVSYMDLWSARRRPVTSADHPLSHLLAERRLIEAEAQFFQFHDHLQFVLNNQPNPGNLLVTDAFRFLPPAGLVPLRTGGFPFGASATRFFQNKSFGPPTVIAGDQLRALFDESLRHGAIDLSQAGFVQLYSVAENNAAQSESNPPQPFIVFVSQYLPYISSQPRFGNLCQTLVTTREAYRSLIERNIFLANETKPEAWTVRISVQHALQRVMSTASERYVNACRCGCGINYEQAVNLLSDLYDAQKGLVAIFNEGWPTSIDVSKLRAFAETLDSYLDIATPGLANMPSLRAAITARNLEAALEAQNAINGLVNLWTGEATVGNLKVLYQSSERGKTLVLEDKGKFKFTFRVTNKTDRTLQIQLQAQFDSPRQSWNSSIDPIQDAAGNEVNTILLQPFNDSNSTNPNAFQDVIVSIATPPDASEGQTGTLRFTSMVPPPTGVSDDDVIELNIGKKEVPEEPVSIRFTQGSPEIEGDPGQASVGGEVRYTFRYVFRTTQVPPQPQNFRFKLSILSDAKVSKLYSIRFGKKTLDPSISTETAKVSLPFPLSNNQQDDVIVSIIPLPGAAGSSNVLHFKAELQSTTDPELETPKPAPEFQVTVKS